MIDLLKKSKSEEDRRKCVPLLQEHLKTNPKDATAWYDLACCFDFLGQELDAEPCYQKTLEIGYQQLPATEQTSFFVGFGSTLRNNFKFKESTEVFEQGNKAFPKYPALKVFAAFTLYTQGKYKEAAQQLFESVSGLEGKVFDGYEKAIQWYVENLENHPAFPIPAAIETERLILRPLIEADAPSILEYCSDPEVSKFTTWMPHKTLEDSMWLIRYAQTNYKKNMPEPFGVTLKSNPGKVIGTVGWFGYTEKHKAIELAYALSPQYWGQGYVVEAVRGLVNRTLKTHDVHRISARCMPENSASSRVMEKLGMQYEGTLRHVMHVKERFRDLKVYSILRDEWPDSFEVGK
jgi:ribosomal-protein-alanine N-acetyltransferase